MLVKRYIFPLKARNLDVQRPPRTSGQEPSEEAPDVRTARRDVAALSGKRVTRAWLILTSCEGTGSTAFVRSRHLGKAASGAVYYPQASSSRNREVANINTPEHRDLSSTTWKSAYAFQGAYGIEIGGMPARACAIE